MQSVVPRSALGYVSDLSEAAATSGLIEDRLQMLQRHCPDLVEEFRAAAKKPSLKSLHVQISEELFGAIESARGEAPRNPWIEAVLWKVKAIRDGADAAGVAKPDRPAEGRGKYDRSVSESDPG
jgi:hypothetical protein